MIYLDHAATAYPRLPVVREVLAQECDSGNPGRSGHGPGLKASRVIFEARLKLAEFLETPCEDRMVFTSGATHSLNKAIMGKLKPHDLVYSTDLEHNAVARVLNAAQKKLSINWDCLDAVNGQFAESIKQKIGEGKIPQLVVMNHVSNVTGVRQDLNAVRVICGKYNIPLIIDAAQSFGHESIQLQKNEVICFSAHKGMMGPMGLGVMAIGELFQLSSVEYGGTGSRSESLEMPEIFPDEMEVGTPNVPAIAAFGAAIDDLKHLSNTEENMQTLRSYLCSSLAGHQAVKLLSPEIGGSAISFDLPGKDLGNFTQMLWDKYQICCRVGLHCSPLAHQSLGTYPNGTIRISIGKMTTLIECESFIKALNSEL